MTNISKDTFEAEVLKSDKPVLVDFWATWCGPCNMIAPEVEAVADERPDIKFCKVNVDDEPELAMQFGVMSIPTLILFKDGQAAKTMVGYRPKEDLLEMLK